MWDFKLMILTNRSLNHPDINHQPKSQPKKAHPVVNKNTLSVTTGTNESSCKILKEQINSYDLMELHQLMQVIRILPLQISNG